MSKLTNIHLKSKNKTGRYPDGNHLYFVIGKNGNKIGLLYTRLIVQKRDGSSPYPEISLKSARLKEMAKALIIEGKDPLKERTNKKNKNVF